MAARIHVVREEIKALKAEGLKLLETAAKDRTPEQSARVDAINAELDILRKDEEALVKMAADDKAAAGI
jgi:hypothetical protein